MTVRPRISVIRVDLDGVSGGGTGAAFTLNASTGSVSLVAGPNITLNSNLSTITIVGAAAAGNTFTLNGTTNSVSIVAGGAIGLTNNASTISISAPVATNFSLNASSSSVSLVAGVGIGFASNASTITISNTANAYSTITATMAGNTLGAASTTLTVGNSLSISGAGAISVGASAGTLTISAPIAAGAATQSFSGGGTSITGEAISVALFGGNNISLASASGAHSLSLTFNASSNALANVSLLNGSSGAMSISAGAGIGIGQANSTITISASVQTANNSLSASGNTTGATSSGTYGSVLAVSGMGIVSVGAGNGTISISATTPTVTNFSTISLSASGNTTGASSGTMNNVLAISGAGIVSVGAGAGGSFTVSATTPTVTNFSTISLTAIGNTTNSSSGTFNNVLQFSGAGAVSVGASLNSITISAPAGAAAATLSHTQNYPLAQISNTVVSKAGTITGTAGVGSSLFLHRLNLPAKINLTEVDIALSINFSQSNNGQGTLSRSLVVYSFGNSTSLASVASVSGTSAWTSGTSTAGGSVSLTQFQGGWNSALIQPMTFAATSIGAGDYVVGQLLDFAQGASTWTLSLYGVRANASNTAITAFTGAISTEGLLPLSASSAGLVSCFTGSTAVNAITGGTIASGLVAGTSGSSTSYTTQTQGTATNLTVRQFALFSTNPVIAGVWSAGGLQGFVGFPSATNSKSAVINANTAGINAAQQTFANFGFIGTGSTTSNFPTAFIAGIMSTGAVPTAITLTSTAVTYLGSAAFQQPWFALAGS